MAVSINAPVIATAKTMTGTGTVSNGSTMAVNYFNANLTTAPADTGYTGLSSNATVSKSGQTVTAVLPFTASVTTFFMGILGYRNIGIRAGRLRATACRPTSISTSCSMCWAQ